MFFLFSEFVLYSFLGFLLEVAYARLLGSRGHGRKCFLLLPLCPVYGLGALAILQIPPLLQSHPLSLFLAGGLLATLTEYVIALFYDRGIGVQFWDYSHQPGNVAGRICPLYTLLWGFLSLALVYRVNPFLSPYLTALPHRILLIFYPLFALDSLLTLCLLHRTGSADSLMWYKTLPLFRRRPLPG